MYVPFHKPAIPSFSLLQTWEAILQSGEWTGGPYTKKYEEAFAIQFGVGYAVAVNSGSSALHLAFSVLPLPPKSLIAVPTWTFAATVAAILHAGHIPLLVDVEPDMLNISTDLPSLPIRAIVPIHYGGNMAAMDTLVAYAQEHNIFIVEDASHALGASYQGKKAGTWGLIAAFSTHATKPLATGQGGLIYTQNPELAQKLRYLRQNGIQRQSDMPWHYEVVSAGHNYQLCEWEAALGLWQLENLSLHQNRRKAIASYYIQNLQDRGPWVLPIVSPESESSWHLFVLRWRGKNFSRDAVIQKLRAEGVACAIHWPLIHMQPAFRDYIHPGQKFPHAEKAFKEVISLPIYPSLSDAQVEYVVEKLLALAK